MREGKDRMTPASNGKSRQDDGDQQSDVALLIDYENLQVSLKRHFNLTTPRMSLIIQEALEYGRLVLSRAYAPWTSSDLSIDAENLYRQGIDLIYTPAGKNSADVRMAVDAVDLTRSMDNIGTIIFVTGDGDLIHPLNYLRQQGNRVVVIGVDAAMSRMLSSAADAVLIYERDLDPSVLRRVTPTPARDTRKPSQPASAHRPEPEPEPEPAARLNPLKNAPPAEEAFRLLRDVLQRHGDGDPMLYQEIGHWLGREHNMKPRAWYGVPFSVFMDAAQAAGHVLLTTSGGNSYASLPSTQIDDSLDDSEDEDDSGAEVDTGASVRLESLQREERRSLIDALVQLSEDPKLKYLTFRTILRHLLAESVLPRLNETQIRSLLNDLANRKPPILERSTMRRRNQTGGTYAFSSFTVSDDQDLLQSVTEGELDG
jgi:uncharacterized protein (TIGR00288 family)